MIEIWKPIKGYEGLYLISNMGNVYSFYKNIILKPNKITNGYYQVKLFNNGKYKCFLVHKLVAEAFIPNPNNYPIINHKDEIKTNNKVNNLEWCTDKYNNNYGTKKERLSKNHSLAGAIATKKNIIQYTKEMEEIKRYESITDASKKTKINISNISMCCLGKRKSAGGYVWKFNNNLMKEGMII